MAAGTRSTDEPLTPRRRLSVLGVGALYLLVAGAVIEIIGMIFDNPMSATLIGAMAVAVIAARAGIAAEPFTKSSARRALVGGGAAALGLALVTGAAIAAGAQITVVRPSITTFFGAAEGFGLAYAGELWLHGLPLLFAERARIPIRYAYPYAVIAGMAPLWWDAAGSPETLVLAGASGAAFTALWIRTGDAWAPVATHFVFAWGVDSLLAGDWLHLSSAAGRLSHGAGAHGLAAWLLAGVFAALTLLVLLNKLPLSRAQLADRDA